MYIHTCRSGGEYSRCPDFQVQTLLLNQLSPGTTFTHEHFMGSTATHLLKKKKPSNKVLKHIGLYV